MGCAPDTFLGAGGQLARKLVDGNGAKRVATIISDVHKDMFFK